MFPENLKQLFGLNNPKDLNMANNIWKMLDEMSENSPQQYKKFVQKNIHQGVEQVKTKKDEKQKPFKFKPEKGFLLEFDVILNQKVLPTQSNKLNQQVEQIHNKLGQKLEDKLILNQQKWIQTKKKFKNKLHVLLNICHSDRIKLPLNKTQQPIQTITLQNIKQIQVFYYSLQGPTQRKQKNQLVQLQYVIILNSRVYNSLISFSQPGKKLLMSLSLSYFQQRFQNDHNPLLKLYNPQIFQKLVFYSIQKLTIQLNSTDKVYFFDNKTEIIQFLIQKQIDTKRENKLKIKKIKLKKKQKKNDVKNKEIIFKKEEQKSEQIDKNSLISGLLINNQDNHCNKKTENQNIKQQKKQTKKSNIFLQTFYRTLNRNIKLNIIKIIAIVQHNKIISLLTQTNIKWLSY